MIGYSLNNSAETDSINETSAEPELEEEQY